MAAGGGPSRRVPHELAAAPAIAGALLGVAMLVPAFRSLTPKGTLRVAAGLPAAVFLRGLLTFSFFGVDAYVPLLLHDWRGQSVAFAGLALTAATLT